MSSWKIRWVWTKEESQIYFNFTQIVKRLFSYFYISVFMLDNKKKLSSYTNKYFIDNNKLKFFKEINFDGIGWLLYESANK